MKERRTIQEIFLFLKHFFVQIYFLAASKLLYVNMLAVASNPFYMPFLRPLLVYTGLFLCLLGWCSFQYPMDTKTALEHWEEAKKQGDLDSLLFYQDRLVESFQAVKNTQQLQEQNRHLLTYIFNTQQLNGGQKKQLLEQYGSSQAWNYAFRVHWHSQYGTRDSAYFYQGLLENLPQKKQALLYAYGQLTLNFGLQEVNYRAALNYLKEAENITQTAQDSQLLYPTQLHVYGATGQLERAIRAGKALVYQYQQEKKIDSIAMATVLGQLSQLCYEQGSYKKATIYAGEAINYLADRAGQEAAIGKLWQQLAKAYYQLQNKPLETILYARNALAKWEESQEKDPTVYIETYQLLARQFLRVEQLDSSQTYLKKAQFLQKESKHQVAESYAIQAAISEADGQLLATSTALQKALEAALKKEGKKGKVVATHWLALGKHYQQQKQWAAARQALTEAFWALSWTKKKRTFPATSSLVDKELALLIGNAQGKTLLALQKQTRYAVSQEVVQQQLEYNLTLLEELQLLHPWKKSLWRQAKQARQQWVEWQWRRFNKTNNSTVLKLAFEQAEANRQAVVREQLQKHWRQNPTLEVVQLQQKMQEQQAFKQWCQEQIWQAYQQQDSSQLNWYRKQLATNKANWTLAKQQLEENYQQYYQWYYPSTVFSLDSLQHKLQEGDALLEYLEAEKAVYQFIVTKDTLLLRKVVWEEYVSTVLKYGKHFTNPKMRQYLASGSFQDFCRTGHSLYYRLVHHDLFKKIQRLIIIPDGLLQQLPFETLLTEIPLDSIHKADFSKLDYLLKSKHIHYHYSSQLWWQSWQPKPPAPNNELLALGATYAADKTAKRTAAQQKLREQLPQQLYMEALLDSLSEYYAGDFYNNRYASEYYYKDYASKYGLLYLGFYGYNGWANQGMPSLVLAEDAYEKEDNFLSFYEIQQQPIQADLVLIGNVYQAQKQDLLALGSSFLYAGSKGVVLPLWQQDSTAVAVVEYYYQGLQKGLANDEALRQAKLHYLQKEGGIKGHPSHWAGYVLVGNQQVVKVAAPITYIWWFVIPIAFIGFLGWWSLQALRQRR